MPRIIAKCLPDLYRYFMAHHDIREQACREWRTAVSIAFSDERIQVSVEEVEVHFQLIELWDNSRDICLDIYFSVGENGIPTATSAAQRQLKAALLAGLEVAPYMPPGTISGVWPMPIPGGNYGEATTTLIQPLSSTKYLQIYFTMEEDPQKRAWNLRIIGAEDSTLVSPGRKLSVNASEEEFLTWVQDTVQLDAAAAPWWKMVVFPRLRQLRNNYFRQCGQGQ